MNHPLAINIFKVGLNKKQTKRGFQGIFRKTYGFLGSTHLGEIAGGKPTIFFVNDLPYSNFNDNNKNYQ